MSSYNLLVRDLDFQLLDHRNEQLHEGEAAASWHHEQALATEREVLWMCVLVPASRVVGRALMLVAEAHLRCDLPADCRNGDRVKRAPSTAATSMAIRRH